MPFKIILLYILIICLLEGENKMTRSMKRTLEPLLHHPPRVQEKFRPSHRRRNFPADDRSRRCPVKDSLSPPRVWPRSAKSSHPPSTCPSLPQSLSSNRARKRRRNQPSLTTTEPRGGHGPLQDGRRRGHGDVAPNAWALSLSHIPPPARQMRPSSCGLWGPHMGQHPAVT